MDQTKTETMWVFQMPSDHEHAMEIDVRHGPTERDGGTIIRGPFDDYEMAHAWLVEHNIAHLDHQEPWPGLWPASHAARVLKDQISHLRYEPASVYLAAGTVCYVEDADETGLFVEHAGSTCLVPFDQVIAVPNFLPMSPEAMAEALPAGVQLVGDLLNDDYTLIRLTPGTTEFDQWTSFLESNLGDDPLVILWKDHLHEVYLAAENPTVVSTARMA